MIAAGGDWNGPSNGSNGQDSDDLSDDAVLTLWRRYCDLHIEPSRLMSIAVGLSTPDENELRHLASCEECRSVIGRYRSDEVTDDDSQTVESSCTCHLKPGIVNGAHRHHALQRMLPLVEPTLPAVRESTVPNEIRNSLRVRGPVLFPNGEVANETWQFGIIEQLAKIDSVAAARITSLIVERMQTVLSPRLARQKIVLVCFGRIVHRIATRFAARLVEDGLSQVHVVLAHDYYSPTLICAPHELRDADVTVIVDVTHTGTLLENLFAVCAENTPACIRGLAFIDQSEGRPLTYSTLALWQDVPEERLSGDAFHQTHTRFQQNLKRFEPNDECAVGFQHGISELPQSSASSIEVNPPFVDMIHRSGALRSDYAIGGKRYPYVVNVLDLFREPFCRDRIVSLASELLADLDRTTTCLVYHAGRSARAGKIAKILGKSLHLPVVPVGGTGKSFFVSQLQFERLSAFRTIALVDAAIRTGDSLTAITQALRDVDPRTDRRFVGFCVLDALSQFTSVELAQKLELDIRTLFKVPLAPPTERIRNWVKTQKAIIREELRTTDLSPYVETQLREYCEDVRRHFVRKSLQSLDDVQNRLVDAANETRSSKHAAQSIGRACKEGAVRLIRHLSLDHVVQDRSVQDMLVGVMYNSMKPTFKESAVFALAAAHNYDWMTYDWLQCNRPFLSAPSQNWKSVLMVECRMKMDKKTAELSRFRTALDEFASKLPPPPAHPAVDNAQKRFPFQLESEVVPEQVPVHTATSSADQRLSERVHLLLDVVQ